MAQYRSRSEKRRMEEKKKRSPVKKMLIIIIGVFVVGMVAMTATAASMISDAPELNAEELTFSEGSTIYDMNDNELGRLQGSENRTYREIDEMPEHLMNAFIAVEDYRFYEHSGIDLYRIGGAIVSNITDGFGSEGASTITQQLVKQAFLSADQSIERKVQEQWLALQMEQQYSKDEILEMYLNSSYFDSSAWGVGEAAIRYFDKENLDELTIADAAVLAAIPRRPSYYNPQNNPTEAEERRDLIISLMEEHAFISEDEATDAMAVNIEDQLDYTPPEDVAYQSIIDHVMEEVENIDGIETTDIYAAGFDIYTTIDPDAQDIAQEVIQSEDYISQYPDNDEFQVGFSLLDTETGAIRAMVGNRQETEEKRGLNYATAASGQPGSTIKPILDYGPAIEELGWYTGETIVDEPHEYSNGDSIRNYGGNYSGEVSMREALVRSLNIPAVKAIQEVGLEDAQAFAEDLGLDFDEDITEGYALGGFGGYLSSLDMAGAYAAFGNEGTYNEPFSVRKMEFRDGREVENSPESEQVMYESTAYMMSDMLKDVVDDSSGTGQRANVDGLPLAGKTGTSNFTQEEQEENDIPDGGVPDVWFNGYTTNYTAAVWTGFSGDRASGYLMGEERNIAQDIFRIVMTNVHEGEGTEDFSRPNSICESDGELYRCDDPPAQVTEEEDEEGNEEETPVTPDEDAIEEEEPEEEDEDEDDEGEGEDEDDQDENEGEDESVEDEEETEEDEQDEEEESETEGEDDVDEDEDEAEQEGESAEDEDEVEEDEGEDENEADDDDDEVETQDYDGEGDENEQEDGENGEDTDE
ncbi:transglycosylase domain-containing protein [Salicibibacter kimchii]|uniref:PBP1A family penicillin-binding protein n=1 Tax=Salicibibacter kimchii TaxID=2099786 RepID=A0A345C2L9_9BACI|nr:PBP1A family penicillin-binding protein [Salicibibacter kimchii]AXF57450.1 PBP1A family penicillin-binding protein [Salicibibacter kimchii]